MMTFLRVAALFVALITIALWFFGGFNLGRTQTVVPVEHPAEDGKTLVVHESRFLPGIDFLIGGFVISAGLFVGSLLKRSSASVDQPGAEPT